MCRTNACISAAVAGRSITATVVIKVSHVENHVENALNDALKNTLKNTAKNAMEKTM